MTTPGQRLRQLAGLELQDGSGGNVATVVQDVATMSPGQRLRAAAGVDPALPSVTQQYPALPQNPGVMPGQVANPPGTMVGRMVGDFGASAVDASMGIIQGQGNWLPQVARQLFSNTPADRLAGGAIGPAIGDAVGSVTQPLANIMGGARSLGQVMPNGQPGPLALSPQGQAGLQAMQGPDGTLLPNTPEGFAAILGQQAPILGVGLATGGAGFVPGMAGIGLAAGGQQMQGRLEQNLAGGMADAAARQDAGASATTAAFLEGATGMIPISRMLRAGTGGAGVGAAAREVGKAAIEEGVQESLTGAAQKVVDFLRTGNDAELAGMGKDTLREGILGAILGGGMGSVAAGGNMARTAIGNRGGPQAPKAPAPPAPNVGGGGVNADETDNETPAPPTVDDVEENAALLAKQDARFDLAFRNRQTKPPAPQVDTVAAETGQPSGNTGQLGQPVSNPDVLEGGTNEQGQARQAVGLQGGESQGDIGSPAITQTPSTPIAVDEGQSDIQAPALGATRGETAMAQPLGPASDVQAGQGAARPSTTSTGQSADLDNDGGPIAAASTPPADTEMRGLPASEPERVSPDVPQAASVPNGRVAASQPDPVALDLDRIAKSTGGKVSRVAAASKGEKAIERRMKDFATDVVYVDDESGKFDGVAIVRDGRRTVYLRKGMDNKQLASVTLHEFGHVLRRENRELHRELVEAVGENRLEAAGEKYREKLAAQFGEDSAEVRRLDEDADVFEDEAVGQLLQDFASEKSDIAELVMSRPGLMAKLKQWLRKVTNKMRSGEANARDSKLADAIVDVLAKAEKRAEESQAQRTGWAKSMAGIRKMVTERATNAGRGGNVYAELENELEGQIKSDDETGGELQSISGFDTGFSGEIPSEVLDLISGDRRLRRALASNQKSGMGEDLVMAIGADKYVAILKSKVYGKQMKNDLDAGIAELLKSRDPDDVVVAKVALAAQDARSDDSKAKGPQSFLRIAELEPGDTFTIWGKKTVMGQNELGELVGVGGALDGVPVYEGMQPIPVDGEVRKGKAPAVVSKEQDAGFAFGGDDIPFSPRAKGISEPAIPGSGRAANAIAGMMDKVKAVGNVARLERAMGRKVQAQAKREAEQAARQSESAANKFAGQASREVARMGRTAMMKDKLLSKEQSKTKVLREELRHNAGILRAEMNRNDRLGTAAVGEVARMGKNAMREAARAKSKIEARDEKIDELKTQRDDARNILTNEMRRTETQTARAERAEAKGSEQASLARTARQARAAVYAIAKQLPADVRGKMLAAVRDASTPREVLAAYAKADEVLGAYEVREADTMLRKIGRRKELAFLGPEVRKEVEAGIAKAAQMREELRLLAKATESPETDEQKKGATGRSIASLMGAGGTQARNMADASKATADVSEDANRKQANTLRRKQNEYVDFANTVRERAAGERLQNKLIREQFNASLKDLTEELRATAVARRSPMPPRTIKVLDAMGNRVTKDSTQSQKPNLIRRLAMVEASLRTIAIDLDRKVDGVLNSMIDKVQRGTNKASDDVNRANRMIDAAARKAGHKDFRDAAVKIGASAGEANAEMVTLRMTAADGGESDIAMTLGQAMYLHALMKESDAGKKLREGQTITLQDGQTRYVADDAFAAQVADVIGPEHVALYDAMQRAAQLNTKAAMDVRLAVTGKVPPIIENYVRTSRDGVFRKPGEGSMPTDVGEGSGPVLTNLPMFQERVANTNTPYRLMNYWDAVQSTIQEQATVAHVAIPLLAVERTLLSGPAAVAIERRYGDRVRKTVRRYLATTAGAAPVQGKIGKIALEVNRKRSRGLVTNLRNIAMNFGGMARVMGEVQMADWTKGFANVGLKGLDEVLAKSSLARSRMRQRYANIQTQTTGNDASYVTDDMNRPSWVDIGQLRTAIAETARSIRAGNIGDAWGKNINEIADSQRLPQYVDALTMTHLWGAKRAEGRRRGLRDKGLEEYTLREFERSLPNVVPSHDAADISGIRLGTNNGVVALGMTFLSEPSSMWQQAHQAYELRNEPGGKGRMTRVVAGFVANAMWSGLMQIVMRKTTITTLGTMPLIVLGLMEPGDDDERKQAAEIRERALGRMSDVIPGVAGSTLAQGGKPGAMNLLRAALGEDQTLIAERSSRVFGSEGGMIWGTANTMYEQFNNLAMAAAQDETEDKLRRAMAAITEIMGEAALSSGLPDDPFDWLASWIRKK